MKMNETSDSSKKYLQTDDLNKIKRVIKDARDNFLLQVLYETGCSLVELISIKVKDIAFRRRNIKFYGDNKRKSIISINLAKGLHRYILGNRLQKKDYVFKTRQSNGISTKRVQQLINYYSKKSGVGKINPQMIRYTHIAHAYKRGLQNQTIANQIGLTALRVFHIIEDLKIIPKKGGYKYFLG